MKELKIHQATGKEKKESWLCLVARVHAWLRKDVSCNCLKSISAQTISDENCSRHILFISDWLRHSSVLCGLSLQVRRKLNIHFLSPQQGFPHVTAAAEAEPGCGQGPVCWASSKVTSWIRLCRWGKRRDSQLGVSARLQGDSKPTVKTRHFQACSEANKHCKEKLLLNDSHGTDDFAVPSCNCNWTKLNAFTVLWRYIPKLDELWKVPPAVGPHTFPRDSLPLACSSNQIITIQILISNYM